MLWALASCDVIIGQANKVGLVAGFEVLDDGVGTCTIDSPIIVVAVSGPCLEVRKMIWS